MSIPNNQRPRGFRIKIDLNELVPGEQNRCWFFVDPNVCKTIADLQRVIITRFHLQCSINEFELRLQDFVIPCNESVDVLQTDDLLVLRRIFPLPYHQQTLNCAEEHEATSYSQPSLRVPLVPCSCPEHDTGNLPLGSTGSKTIEDDADQMPSTHTAPCSTPIKKKKKKKKSKELPDAVAIPEVTKKPKKHRREYVRSSDEEVAAKKNANSLAESPKSNSKKSKKSKKSKEPLDTSNSSLIQEGTQQNSKSLVKCQNSDSKKPKKSKEASNTPDSILIQEGTQKNSKSLVKSPNTDSKKSKKSEDPSGTCDSSLIRESRKKKERRGSDDSGIAKMSTTSKNGLEQSPKRTDEGGVGDEITFQELPKKKRRRNRKSKSKSDSITPSGFSTCDVEDVDSTIKDKTPRVSKPKPAFDFGSRVPANHFRFDIEDWQSSSSDSSGYLIEQTPLPRKSPRAESGAISEEPQLANSDATQENNVKRKSPSRALAANIPNLNKNPDVAVEENEVRAIDYSQYPALVGHPRVKDVVAYKVLELSAEYMPKVSDYFVRPCLRLFVGEVISSDPSTKEVTIQFLTPIITKARRGKFELLEEEDFDEEVEPEDEIETEATIEWQFVIDAKLLPNGG